MTADEFNAEYKLGQRIASGSVDSYLAHVTATRRLVMVHRLAGTTEGERRRINSLIGALPTRGTTILAHVNVDGEQVIVTEFLPDFTNLRDWLETAVAAHTTVVIRTGPPGPPVAPPAAPATQPDGGDFTRLFGQPAVAPAPTPISGSPSPSAPVSATTPSAPTPPAAPPPGPATGSFTALFGAALEPAPPVAPPLTTPVTSPPASFAPPPSAPPPVAPPPASSAPQTPRSAPLPPSPPQPPRPQ